ncbi:MAG TPA: bifunctional phosphopantothenoylcysteine decarboxylase/phosphopantothenate--cysteine ligase CoaBC [Gemmatimonadaceae bacterium]|nr:bifunctional phosphopantothenoylcysteine decarboxylase/phosphopantothenate--cysteine ligase CoaBC [Gemmatimonadaceae bacterium]
MRPFGGARILLGVSGGIAAYKAGWVARLLAAAGAEVDVVMTRAATQFIAPLTFEALTGRAVRTDIFSPGHALDHIHLAREADIAVVAPATADFLSRAAHGRADDLLAACLLATTSPVILFPAMNDAMWVHPQTQRNAAHLRELGYTVVDPDVGALAAGEGSGPGRLPEPETIVAHVARALDDASLRGRTFVVTAGPTREPVDPVRFLSNRSSGKMGVAIASAAWRRGAKVVLIAGPLEVPDPVGPSIVRVETTDQMADAVRQALPDAHALVMAAAPADFRAAEPVTSKIKKSGGPASIALAATIDILACTVRHRPPGLVVVGFALETDHLIESARAKLADKQLDFIVANSAHEPDAGFGADTNRVTILGADGSSDPLPVMPKTALADQILDRVEALLRAR